MKSRVVNGIYVVALLMGFCQAPAAKASVSLSTLSRELREASLDPEACFRVREFAYRRNEVRLFLTEGVLMFRKPVNGIRTGAVFVATEELEDAEILMIPPNRMERRSLASFTGSPNLDEHFRAAVFLFTDGTRLIEDLSNGGGPGKGCFFAAISGKKLGNFDLFFDPRGRVEMLVGQLENIDGRSRYNFWAHFEPKRAAPRSRPGPPLTIEHFGVSAVIGEDLHLRATIRLNLKSNQDGQVAIPVDLSPR